MAATHHAPARAEATTRVTVTVTFLRLERFGAATRQLPGKSGLLAPEHCTVPFYRFLYATVGEPYVWWLRRSLDDAAIAAVLADPAVSVHVLYVAGQPAGFFELDRRAFPAINLSYFGLMPHVTGQRLGTAFLHTALRTAQAMGARAVTVNTCTADHPRALPGYVAAGFQPVRSVQEVWHVPVRLGLSIPARLLV